MHKTALLGLAALVLALSTTAYAGEKIPKPVTVVNMGGGNEYITFFPNGVAHAESEISPTNKATNPADGLEPQPES